MTYIKEKRLMLLLSRLTFSENNIEEINLLIKRNNINWFEFFKYGFFNKTAILCWKNIKKLGINVYIPRHLNDILKFSYLALKERNMLFEEEKNNILNLLMRNNIPAINVKGTHLIPILYGDYGVRFSGDIDFLIDHKDIPKIKSVMNDNGYLQGKYNEKIKKIEMLSRKEYLKWKMSMSNLYPFIRISENKLFSVYKIDFRFALDDTLNTASLNEIMSHYVKFHNTRPMHYLVHLCIHLYDEAKQSMNVYLGKEINMIKFTDIREYILKYMNESEWTEAIQFCKRYNLNKQLYYVLYYLKILFNDGYENKYISKIDIEGDLFLISYGNNALTDEKIWRKNFFDRMFSCNNNDELDCVPKFYDI